LESTVKEINVMNEIQNPYIVQFYGSFLKEPDLWIVMEYCGAGSMSDILKMCKTTLTEDQIAYVMKDSLKGLAYLHGKKKIHRDIKAGNILVTAKGEAKLADFGVSGQLMNTMEKKNTVIGSPFWMAPEVIQEIGHNSKADIWSLGITCIELAEGKPPYHNIHPMRVIFMIPSKNSPTLKDQDKYSPDFHDFIAKCLQKNPDARPTSEELLKHPFITKAKGPEVISSLLTEVLRKIADGALRDDDDDVGTVKPNARPKAVDTDDGGDEVDEGTMVEENFGTMITSNEDAPQSEPDFMQMIKMGGQIGKMTNLDDLIKGGNVAALEEMIKDLEINKEKELQQNKEKFEKKRKPILEALAEK
jgi:serine/threonine protein kinase